MQPAGKGADNGAHHPDPPFADHDPPIVDEDQDTWDTDSALGGVRSYAYDHPRPSFVVYDQPWTLKCKVLTFLKDLP